MQRLLNLNNFVINFFDIKLIVRFLLFKVKINNKKVKFPNILELILRKKKFQKFQIKSNDNVNA